MLLPLTTQYSIITISSFHLGVGIFLSTSCRIIKVYLQKHDPPLTCFVNRFSAILAAYWTLGSRQLVPLFSHIVSCRLKCINLVSFATRNIILTMATHHAYRDHQSSEDKERSLFTAPQERMQINATREYWGIFNIPKNMASHEDRMQDAMRLLVTWRELRGSVVASGSYPAGMWVSYLSSGKSRTRRYCTLQVISRVVAIKFNHRKRTQSL